MADYLKSNCDYWSQAVYDNINPETYVFRIYGRVIVYEFGMDGSGNENLLDFGCGSGGSSKFFASKGFNVYGADQSKVDIERCKKRIPDLAEQFKVVSPNCKRDDIWFPDIKFKIITSFQTLYYLDDHDLQERLLSFHNMMEPGGIFIATMMHKSSWYYDMSSPAENGMRFVKFRRKMDEGRPGLKVNDHYINFTNDAEDLKNKFKIFQPIHYKGFYDGVYRDDQGSEKHLVFIGKKIG